MWCQPECRVVTAVILGVVWVGAASAQDRGRIDYDYLHAPGWERIGGFKGATGANIMGRVNDLLFEQEANGSLYRDLGDVTLGLGYSPDNGEIRWENSFFRRVLPLHREIAPGGLVTGEDLSSYLDIRSLISRGRMRIEFINDIVGESGAVGSGIEGGVSLSLGRIHPALELADRPLDEALADPEREIVKLTQPYPEDEDKSLLRMATEGATGLTQWIASSIGDKTIDTERSSIFYGSYGDTVSLFLDVGVPVEAEPFRQEDPRLGPGDFVRQITFIGISPIVAGMNLYGFEVGYQHFYRYLRETTIVKEEHGTVLVRVRTALAKGDEATPLKVRPEIRILGILTLGYTFFDQVFTLSKDTSYDTVFRIDLEDPRGMAAFKDLLGDGNRARLKPLAEAAVERDGADQLAAEVRLGKSRSALRRFRCFSLFNYRRWRVASQDLIEVDGEQLHESVVANSWSHQKTLGRDQNRSRQLLIRALSGVSDSEDRRKTGNASDVATVSMITGIRDEFADGEDVRRSAEVLRRALPWDDHPLLDELVDVDPAIKTRLALNLSLSMDDDHLDLIENATEAEIWTELADLLLGSSLHDAWSTPEKREAWQRAARSSSGGSPEGVVAPDAIEIRDKPVKPKARYRLARRSVKKFGKLQELVKDGDCLGCLTDAFRKWESASIIQILMARIASRDPEDAIAYHYEVFFDDMLRPATVANDVELGMPIRTDISDTVRDAVVGQRGFEMEGEAVANNIMMGHRRWQGDRFLEPAQARLEGGQVLLNVGADPTAEEPSPPCLMLRLYSDLRFEEDLRLRIDLRQRRTVGADIALGHATFSMGEPTEVTQTPFMSARYSYDIPLPASSILQEGEGYSLLIRLLNSDGLPVSEEELANLTWPAGGLPPAAKGCTDPVLIKPPIRTGITDPTDADLEPIPINAESPPPATNR